MHEEEAETREALLRRLSDVQAHEIAGLTHWAGTPSGVALAVRGARAFGAARWPLVFAADPERWLVELDGPGPRRKLRRSLFELPSVARRVLGHVASAEAGFTLTHAAAAVPDLHRHLPALRARGWIVWRGRDRIAVPGMRRALLRHWLRPSKNGSWLAAYARQALAQKSWCGDEQACIAEVLPTLAPGLDAAELNGVA
ncbi:MAG: hypothetical protein AAF411_02350, partial [Myxococcota bacterium]